ncbi:glucosamine-6-phosphate deaminase [Salmonella enterica subsp. enterica serovar Montevideo]|nr:glucosamine-6-phosphate deaminase [Salmonella enterica subsp. enterica serovar Montevideo]
MTQRRFWYFYAPQIDAPRDKCAHFREINGIAAAFQYLQKNYIPTALSFL